ncbi:MAG: hypothetical protein M3R51_00205 [Candidatus Eremiobacteraeota bacterium]|nr:hypothetical protein [Candidatus Eremiobacteraeota bacterium]
MGVPLLSANYDFGLRAPRVPEKHVANETGPLPVIASVVSQSRDYDVTMLGTETLKEASVFHLGLRPLRDPGRYRLRELWIDETNHLPVQAIVAGNFTLAPMTDVPWRVDFQIISNVWNVSKESALATLYLAHQRVVREASIDFDNVTEPDGIYGPAVEPEATSTTLLEP